MTRLSSLFLLGLPLALAACGDKDASDDSSAADDSNVTTDDSSADDSSADDSSADDSSADDSSADDSSADDSSADDSGTDDSGADDSGTSTMSEIERIQRGEIEVGATVTIEGVAGHDGTRYGVHVLDGRSDTYAGVYVYWGTAIEVSVARGDRVTVTGLVEEYVTEGDDTFTEVIIAAPEALTVVSSGEALPAPVVLTVAQLADPATAEAYESVLVKVENVAVTNADLGFGEWEIDGAFRVDDLLYDWGGVLVGETFTGITGFVYSSYGSYKLAPRDAADFEGYTPVPCAADKCVEDLVAGDVVVTEFMPNPSSGVGDDDFNEWIELYNASGGSVNLAGLVVEDDGDNQGNLSADLIVNAGEYVVIAKGDGTRWGYTSFTASGWYGGNPALGNGGDQVLIKRDAADDDVDAIDIAAAYPDGNSGRSWQLDASVLDHTANDDSVNWCESSVEFQTGEYGSPGAANAACPQE